MIAASRIRRELALIEEDVAATCERVCLHGLREQHGGCVGMDTHAGEISTELGLHLLAHGSRQWVSIAARCSNLSSHFRSSRDTASYRPRLELIAFFFFGLGTLVCLRLELLYFFLLQL